MGMPEIPLQFSDIGNALAIGAHGRYYATKARQEEEEAKGLATARPDLPAAIAGDPAALGRVAQASPTLLQHIAPALARMDANKRAGVKAAAEFTTQAANAILQANPADRPAIYSQMIELGKSRGHDMSGLPPQYTPQLDPMLRTHRAMGISVLEQFKQDNANQRHNTPQATNTGVMEPLNGPMPAAPARPAPAAGPRPMSAVDPGPQPTAVADAAPPMPANVQQGGDAPAPADGSGTPVQPPQQQGAIWTVDPSTQGYQMMGHRAKPGAPLLPAEVAGHFVYRNPQTGETVLYKPREQKPTERLQPAPGYRWAPTNGPDNQPRQEFIPGGNADPDVIKAQTEVRRTASEKAIPQTVTKGMQENLDALKQIDRALAALGANEKAVGGVGEYLQQIAPGVGGDINNKYIDPKGTQARALISDIGSLKIHDRSGAAVTAAETPRLIPFIPKITDSPQVIRGKLANFRAVYSQMLEDTLGYYSPDNGFKAYQPALDYLQGKTPAASPGTPAQPSANKERPPLSSFEKKR